MVRTSASGTQPKSILKAPSPGSTSLKKTATFDDVALDIITGEQVIRSPLSGREYRARYENGMRNVDHEGEALRRKLAEEMDRYDQKLTAFLEDMKLTSTAEAAKKAAKKGFDQGGGTDTQ
jgi:hypothetical protein